MSLIKKLWFEEGLYPDEDYDFLDIDETELGNYDFFDLDEDESVTGDDDGVFNFGDIDEGDETAEGDYDMNQDTPPPEDPTDINVDFGDEDEYYEEHRDEEAKNIDFTDEDEWWEENDEYGYDNYDFGNIDQEEEPYEYSYTTALPTAIDQVDDGHYNFEDLDGGEKTYDFEELEDQELYDNGAFEFKDIDLGGYDDFDVHRPPVEDPMAPDEGLYNFGDIDEGDETAEGDWNFGELVDHYDDDGAFNFGDIDEGDETAVGDYDYGDEEDGYESQVAVESDFEILLTVPYDDPSVPHEDEPDLGDVDLGDEDEQHEVDYDFGDEDEGTAPESDDETDEGYEFNMLAIEQDPIIDEPDDGVYNFGDIDLGDETANGDYDMESVDQPYPIPEDERYDGKATGDFDFNLDPPENVRPEDEDTGMFDFGEIVTSDTDISKDFVDENEYLESVQDFGWENYDFYSLDVVEDPVETSYQTVFGVPTDPDDEVYNFGDLDEGDETAVGDYDMIYNPPQERPVDEEDDGEYDFADIDEAGVPAIDKTDESEYDSKYPANRDYGDADVEEESGEEYAEVGTAVGDWDMNLNAPVERHPEDEDEGEFNFGDIDEGDETAEGDYDYGDAEDDEEYIFDFTDADERDLFPTQFDIDYDFGELDLIGFQQTKDFLVKSFREVIEDMTHDPDFEIYEESDMEQGIESYIKFQYWYNERTNKSFIQYNFYNHNHNMILDRRELLDRITRRIKAQFKYDTGIIPEIVNCDQKDVVPDNRRTITPYIIGYWESINGGYETLEDRAEVRLDSHNFIIPPEDSGKRMEDFFDIARRIRDDYNLTPRNMGTDDKNAYIQEYYELLKHRSDADFATKLQELNDRYQPDMYNNANIPAAFNEYWDEYKEFFGYKLPSVYYFTRRCNIVVKNIA